MVSRITEFKEAGGVGVRAAEDLLYVCVCVCVRVFVCVCSECKTYVKEQMRHTDFNTLAAMFCTSTHQSLQSSLKVVFSGLLSESYLSLLSHFLKLLTVVEA